MRSWPLLICLLLAAACTPLQRLGREAARVAAPLQALVPAGQVLARGCPPAGGSRSLSAIRSLDAEVRSLLLDGCRQSPSLQRLADAIGHTDGVVYVSIGPCPLRGLRGCLLHTIKDTGNARYLWIRFSANNDSREMISTMAHELQHALEVLAHAAIRSQGGLLEYYRSLDSNVYTSTILASPYRAYETNAAIRMGDAVRGELTALSGAETADDRQ